MAVIPETGNVISPKVPSERTAAINNGVELPVVTAINTNHENPRAHDEPIK